MESFEGYLDRKFEELKLLNSCLSDPIMIDRPGSIAEVIQNKFQLTALLRAAHEMQDWNATETAWSSNARPSSGAFSFRYDYQRADLVVEGPSFYALDSQQIRQTIYAASGMAAMASLLLAVSKLTGGAEVFALPGSYAETLELFQGYAGQLRLIVGSLEGSVSASSCRLRILLLDSCISSRDFADAIAAKDTGFDLVVFDTTCFASTSTRVGRVVRWCRRRGIPLVLVRSHTKLDTLGAEYGRLGSISLLNKGNESNFPTTIDLELLTNEIRNAIRLLGNAALPAHFPPYVGEARYRDLTRRRIAAILRNGRASSQLLASHLTSVPSQLNLAHGLYVTLGSHAPLDETTARQAAGAMSSELSAVGFPIRHAGSFGFDFAATEWFYDPTANRYSVRVAIPDLPSELWSDLTLAIRDWWLDFMSHPTALNWPENSPQARDI